MTREAARMTMGGAAGRGELSISLRRVSVRLAVGAVLVLAFATRAGAAVVEGSASDPIDDGCPETPTNCSPGFGSTDLTGVQAIYDNMGRITVSVRFRDPPLAIDHATVGVIFGTAPTGFRCTGPAAGVVGSSAGGGAVSWTRLDAAGNATAKGQGGTDTSRGDTTTLSVSDPRLAGGQFACAWVELAHPDPFNGSAQPEDFIDAFKVAPPAPRLVLFSTIPHELGRGQSRTTRVIVTNSGDLTAGHLTVKVAAGRGLRVSSTRLRLGAVKPGAVARGTLRIALGRHAHPGIPVSLTATGGGATATSRLRIAVSPPALARPRPGSLAGRDFWHSNLILGQGWDNQGIVFIDNHWAYRGFPPHGIPRCPSAGCVRYTYNRRTGQVRVGGQTGRYTAGGLTIGEGTYLPLVIPPAGKLYDVSLVNQSTFGLCPNCSTTTKDLSLTRDGLFSLEGSIAGTSGVPSGVFTSGFAQSPSTYGIYEIDPRGQIRLMFANGKVEIDTIAIQPNKGGNPSTILIGAVNYYHNP